MIQKILMRAAAAVASLLFLVLLSAPVRAEEFSVKGVTQEGIGVYPISFKTTYAVNDFSQAIPSCQNMTVYWERGNSAQVTLYPADSDDDTVAEIEANTLIKTFTTNTRHGPFTPTKAFVRFVVDTVNASVPSSAKVVCSNYASSGGVRELAFADFPTDGNPAILIGTDCATSACNAGGGSTRVALYWDGVSYEPVDATGGVTGLTNPLTADVSGANDYSLTNLLAVGGRNFFVRTQAQLEAALELCNTTEAPTPTGIGSNEFTGCSIFAEGGTEIDIATTVAICGDGTAALGCNGLRLYGAGGGIQNNTNYYSNQGTVFRWTGAAGGTMFEIGACNNCEFSHFAMEGDNNSTPGNDAAVLMDFLGTTSTATKGSAHHLSLAGATTVAIRMPAAGQVDEFQFHSMSVVRNAACYKQQYTQTLGITLGPNFICSQNTGTGPFIDIDQGELVMETSYCGIVANNSTCIEVNRTANRVFLRNNQFEGGGYSSPVFIDMDDGAHSSVQQIEVSGNNFIIDASSTSAVAFDYLGRGAVVWEGNKYVANSGTPGLAVTIDVPTGQKLQVASSGNTYNQGSEPAFRWLPTLDTEAIVDSPVVSMNGTLITPCGWWEVGRNTAGTSGEQLYTCESGSWVQSKAGDPVSLETIAVTAANGVDFQAGSGFIFDTSGGGDPLAVVLQHEYGFGYGSALPVEQCLFSDQGTGMGGFICEGLTANATEFKLSFTNLTDSGADTERFIPLSSAGMTVTPGTSQCARFDSSGNLVAATADCFAAASLTGNLDLGTGTIKGSVPIESTSSTAFTLTTARGNFVFADEAGATQIELPALASGSNFCVYSATAQVISLNPNGTEAIFLDGTSIGAGDELDSPGALGDFVCLLSNGTSWYVIGKAGTWVDGGAS